MGIFPPDEHGNAADQDAGADGDNDQTQGWRFSAAGWPDAQRAIPTAVEAAMARIMAGTRGRLKSGKKKDGQHSAQHDKLALGKVDDPRRIVDNGETETDQGIDGAVRKPGQGILNDLHCCSSTALFGQYPVFLFHFHQNKGILCETCMIGG